MVRLLQPHCVLAIFLTLSPAARGWIQGQDENNPRNDGLLGLYWHACEFWSTWPFAFTFKSSWLLSCVAVL